jgi:hypothetical protein
MARPNLSSLVSKFLFRETLTSEEKGSLRSDIAASSTTGLQAETAARIAGDQSLSTALSNEVQARIAGDTAESILEQIGEDGKIRQEYLSSPAQIMSAVGERLIESLKVPRPNHAGTCHFTTTSVTSAPINVKTSTSQVRLINSDNTFSSPSGYGYDPDAILSPFVPASGLHRALAVVSVSANGVTSAGTITSLDFHAGRYNGTELTSFNGSALSGLLDLTIKNNDLTSFSGAGMSALESLDLTNNEIQTFSGTGLNSLNFLYLDSNNLTSFDPTGVGVGTLDLLSLRSNSLTSFDATGLTLTHLDLSDNQLIEIDSILIVIAANDFPFGYLDLSGGTNAARTSASDAAYATLTTSFSSGGLDWTVILNS